MIHSLLIFGYIEIGEKKISLKRKTPLTASSPRLESLPQEMLQMVLDELDPVFLRYMTGGLRALIPPVDEKGLSRCQR